MIWESMGVDDIKNQNFLSGSLLVYIVKQFHEGACYGFGRATLPVCCSTSRSEIWTVSSITFVLKV